MSPVKLALKYMDIVFSGEDLDRLRSLFAEALVFEGPLFTFNTAEEYINSLKSAPPVGFKYKISKSWEDEHSACLIYQFFKPGVNTPMSQWFEVENERITKILLIFDSGVFDN